MNTCSFSKFISTGNDFTHAHFMHLSNEALLILSSLEKSQVKEAMSLIAVSTNT